MSHAALVGLRVDRPATATNLREDLRRIEKSRVAGQTIVIDPGHGGADAGATDDGLAESDICWRIATRVADRLASFGARVRFTRNEPDDPDHSTRAQFANDVDGDLFVSIHLNSHEESSAEGCSTYFFGSSSAGAALADKIQTELVELGLRDCRSHARSYSVLRETKMPAVLIEPAFISNELEAKRLRDPEFLSQIAEAIGTGIRRFYEESVIPE
jgi:N-acetylmuramoyl-L-alanine amidase